MAKTKVLILGGGLAGLATAYTLLTQSGGALDVEVVERGHVFGGKASSMPHTSAGQTFEIDHGLHVFFEYPNFLKILEESAPGSLERLPRQEVGAHAVVPGLGKPDFVSLKPLALPAPLHLLGGLRAMLTLLVGRKPVEVIAGGGLSRVGKNLVGFGRLSLAGLLLRPEKLSPLERRRLDEMSFREFATELGIEGTIADSDLFKAAADAMFSPVASAFAMLRSVRMTQQSAGAQRVRYIDGPCAEVLIEPLTNAIERAGGKLRKYCPVTRIATTEDGRAVLGVHLAKRPRFPHAVERANDTSYFHSVVPDFEPTADAESADYYVSALPPKALGRVLDPNSPRGFHRAIDRLGNHSTGATISCQIYYDRMVTPESLSTLVIGTGDVFSAVIDRARVWRSPDSKGVPPGGSILEFVGTAPRLSDEEVTRSAEQLAKILFPLAKEARVVKVWFHRSNHDEYFKILPRTDADRPRARTPITGLFVAGDYTNNSFGNVGMEGAVVSGVEAANEILRELGHPERPVLPMAQSGAIVDVLRTLLKYTGTQRLTVGYCEWF